VHWLIIGVFMNSFNFRKSVKKSIHWWRHGKHSNLAEIALMVNKSDAKKKRLPQEMYSSVQEAMDAAKKERDKL